MQLRVILDTIRCIDYINQGDDTWNQLYWQIDEEYIESLLRCKLLLKQG